MKLQRLLQVAAGVGVLTMGTFGIVRGADHLDPADRVFDPPGDDADISDVYAWHTSAGNLVIALTFSLDDSTDFSGNRDILYAIQIDDADENFEPNTSIYVRFAQNRNNEWGVQFTGVPGITGPVEGPVGTIIDLGGALFYAGVRDDPFFFDFEGFLATNQLGTLSFDPTRDFFRDTNISAIVVELPIRVLPFRAPFRVWATTARIQ